MADMNRKQAKELRARKKREEKQRRQAGEAEARRRERQTYRPQTDAPRRTLDPVDREQQPGVDAVPLADVRAKADGFPVQVLRHSAQGILARLALNRPPPSPSHDSHKVHPAVLHASRQLVDARIGLVGWWRRRRRTVRGRLARDRTGRRRRIRRRRLRCRWWCQG